VQPTSFVDYTINQLAVQNFVSPEFGAKCPYFGVTRISLTLLNIKGSSNVKNQLYPSSCFDTTPACDGRTDGRRDARQQHIPH